MLREWCARQHHTAKQTARDQTCCCLVKTTTTKNQSHDAIGQRMRCKQRRCNDTFERMDSRGSRYARGRNTMSLQQQLAWDVGVDSDVLQDERQPSDDDRISPQCGQGIGDEE